MARLTKYSTGIVGEIKHNIRDFKDGICPTNMEVDPTRTKYNYSLLRRGNTALEIEHYRKQIEGECFHYNRKNLIHANEVICTLPKDCPKYQELAFFQESLKYIASTLPMGERCIFLAEVHCDEGRMLKDNQTVVEGAKHLHVMYVPAVPYTKHEGFDYKLNSDQLTRRNILMQWHSSYQSWLDNAGISATVASGVTSGKGISVKAMKEVTKATGLSYEQIQTLKVENERLHEELKNKEHELSATAQKLQTLEKQLVERDHTQSVWGTNAWESEIEEERTY